MPNEEHDVDPHVPEAERARLERIAAEAERGRLERIASVHRELAELEAVNDAVTSALQMRSTRTRAGSVAYSIRLGREELEALERRAATRGLKPTVLARNLIRVGLAPGESGDLIDAIERVAAALDDLRALVGATPMRSGFD